ncbi:hypothetical protein EXU85_23195 [Spirosoma sp. KCTC 42546]|uniref:hypothetical protein n=1 Tax=Spirosoma sp. KCTC 42546 TaxID=2520506 RepID=UPI00115ACDD6|nr:hypothetical protein [Spirosoma sp. KCTC 42546]QDK81357.1 hypothetical protein EXU85_23195 [Spirosoma sp. KCTC 42546]
MKVLFIVCLSLFLASQSYAQVYVDGVAIDTTNTPFCQLICTNANGFSKARILIDHGQHFVDSGLSRQKIADADKRVIAFNSSIDALNFMVRHGWELVTFKLKGDTFIYLLQRKKI